MRGREVAVCGPLLTLTRAEAARKLGAAGARFAPVPRRSTQVAVITDADCVGARRIGALREAGVAVEVIDEAELLRRLGEPLDLARLFSAEQLAQAVGLAPADVRAFVREGWLAPTRTIRRLQLFDFKQMACARDLAALRKGGVKPAALRRALRQLRRWHPDAESIGGALQTLERGGELLVRTPDGRLAEPCGQLRLQFDLPAASRLSAPRLRFQVDPLVAFEAALQDEADGRYEDALLGYGHALAGFGREPEILFNLGNVLYALGRTADAAAHFLDAVTADGEFAEAWNNLGNALLDVGKGAHAQLAYRRALELRPDYADAHFNLAEALHAQGESAAARAHWQAYLHADPFSRWARRARARLAAVH